MSAHTKTPWVLDTNCGRDEHEVEIKQQPGGWFLVIGAGYTFDKMAYPDEAREEFYANAAHIVHCVNNFDALVKACQAIDEQAPIDSEWGTCSCCNKRSQHETDCAVSLARAALASATGAA